MDLTVHLVSDESQVDQYAKNIYLYQNRPSDWFYGHDVGKIPYGTKVRCTYNKVGSNARKFIIVLEVLK